MPRLGIIQFYFDPEFAEVVELKLNERRVPVKKHLRIARFITWRLAFLSVFAIQCLRGDVAFEFGDVIAEIWATVTSVNSTTFARSFFGCIKKPDASVPADQTIRKHQRPSASPMALTLDGSRHFPSAVSPLSVSFCERHTECACYPCR